MCAHWKTYFEGGANANFLFCHDLLDKERDVIIEKVSKEEMTGDGGKKTKKPTLTFRGAKKQLGLNKTNCKTIATMYGTEVKGWVGKSITLYPSTTTFGGEIRECIRVKNIAPLAGKSAGALNDVPPPQMTDEERNEALRMEREGE